MPAPLSPLPFVEALNYAIQRKVVLPDAYYGAQPAAQRAQSFSVAGLAQIEQIKAVKKSLDDHLSAGGSFKDWVEKVRGGEIQLDLSLARLDNIFRTNVQAAYNNGRYTQQTDPVALKLRPYWMYDAINDSRTRPTHHAMDNTVLPASDPWWSTHYPPNGYRCRCTVISLTAKQAQARGITADPPNVQPDAGFGYSPADYATPVVKAISDELTKAEITTTNASAQIATAAKKIDDAAALSKLQAKDTKALEDRGLQAWGPEYTADFKSRVKKLRATDPLAQLPEHSLRTLYAYTTRDFRTINDVLRNPARYLKDIVMTDVVRAIRGAFQSVQDTPVYEGALGRRVNRSKLPDGFLSAHEVGNVIQYNGVTSTSKSADQLRGAKLAFYIEGPNTGSIDVQNISYHPDEAEVVFKPGTKFQVTRREDTVDGTVIYLKVVSDSVTAGYQFALDGDPVNLTPDEDDLEEKMTDQIQVGEPNAAAKWAAILGEQGNG